MRSSGVSSGRTAGFERENGKLVDVDFGGVGMRA